MRFSSELGQSTVEAAVLLPVLFAVFGLFLQPGILLYNRCIMNASAVEGCRLVSTGMGNEADIRAYMQRRLDAIPKLSIFHDGDDWDLNWTGAGSGSDASMSIVNHSRPLPLFGIIAGLTGSMASDGCIEQRVEASCSPVPSWVGSSGSTPSDWVGAWK